MRKLRSLDVSGNRTLTRLDSAIATLKLTHFKCDGCYNLIEPPYALCKGGFTEIDQYYKDLAVGKETMILSSIVLMGRKEAGKSTLLKSMSNNFKPCTKDNCIVEKTEVFEFQELTLRGDSSERKVTVVDFGGDEVYHYAYHLTFNKDSIPLVVVNMEEYEYLAEKHGRREATRKVAFDWLSHLITTSQTIQPPLTAFTHSDCFIDKEKFKSLSKEFRLSIRELLQELKTNTPKWSAEQSGAENYKSFFGESDTFNFGFNSSQSETNYNEAFLKLEQRLLERVEKSECVVPTAWKSITNISKNMHLGFLSFKNLMLSYPEPRLKTALNFLRRAGKILMYGETDQRSTSTVPLNPYGLSSYYQFALSQSPPVLQDIIFHNIQVVKQLIGSLYNHKMDSSVVIQESRPGTSDGCPDNIYFRSGVLHRSDLQKLINCQPEEEFEVFVALLLKFKLLYGPTVINNKSSCYLIPYFMQHHEFQLPTAEISLRAVLSFIGLKVPNYAFHQITVAFLQYMEARCEQIYPYSNGASATVKQTDIQVHLTHEVDSQKVILATQGDAVVIKKTWEIFVGLLRCISKEVQTAWPATKILYEIPCPHCLILHKPNPVTLHPQLLLQESPPYPWRLLQSQTTAARMKTDCGNDTDIPPALIGPCK